ncbi:endonuclease [Winogradskyella maritima]|uniref:Endonuclease n=1 Tax=Winogradskyella maritima TaxID=1517766 RepID=A0ABV8AKV0_9FLAO|nr:endonuclease [Winogradskyella maritima]
MRYFTLLLCFGLSFAYSQDLLINELDCDSAISEDLEFIELKSPTPNFTISNRVLVFFNGSPNGMDSSYFVVNLDGAVTDGNGLLTIGSTSVTPFPQLLISGNTIQNGADAVAIYEGTPDDFPEGTLATITNLVDVLIYDTSDADDAGLIGIFSMDPRFTDIQQINEGSGNNSNSIQRQADLSWETGTPNPRQTNDGSGIVFNPIEISTDKTIYDEGETVQMTFTAERPVDETLDFSVSLSNFGFATSDYSGSTNLSIAMGETSTSTAIQIIANDGNEGDEDMEIKFSTLNEPIIAFNNFVKVRIVDLDIITRAWGTPIDPTTDKVASTTPTGYYNSLDGLQDQALRHAITAIIADPTAVRTQTYADVIDILKQADENPENTNQVWLVYTEQARSKADFQTSGGSNVGLWNREHTFPASRGGFFQIEADEIADGISQFITTNADSTRHGMSDAHALRAVDGPENSSRGNKNYGEYTGPTGNAESFKGDVARSVLYMDLRYNALNVVNGFPVHQFNNPMGELGDLATLLQWHRYDPVDDFEKNRNNVVYLWQNNRNPFIDQPLLVEYIWGNQMGQVWNQSLSTSENELLNVSIYPNPTEGVLNVVGLTIDAKATLYGLDGKRLKDFIIRNNEIDLAVASGLYLLRLTSEGSSSTFKIMVD